MNILPSLSQRALTAPESGIVEVVNYARGRPGLIPLWVGEGDEPTPDFINQAAISALTAGETFYTWQRGIPELRHALSRYYTRHFQTLLPYDNFYVTGSGMQAIRIGVEAITGPGDEMIYLSPAWPNIVSALELSGARAVSMPLDYIEGRWSLDLERLEHLITPRTKGLFINSPSNPTGWAASSSELSALLDLSRRHNI